MLDHLFLLILLLKVKTLFPFQEREKERTEFLAKPSNKYLQYTAFRPKAGDVIVKQESSEKQTHHDRHLRKFEHTKVSLCRETRE